MQVFTVVTPHILYHKNIINGDKNVRGLQKSTKCNAKDRGIMEQKAPLKKDNLKLSNEESNRITKESLTIALIRLMAKKDFKRITITELVQCAGVSRTAFYRNYTSKEDIIRELTLKTAEELKKSLNLGKYKNNLCPWLVDYFHLIEDNADLIRVMLNADYPNLKLYDFLDYYTLSFEKDTAENRYKYLFFTSGLNSITFQWIKTGLKESAEDMAKISMDFMKPENSN